MGFFDRLTNAWYIFTTSLSFIQRDKSLLAVPLLLLISGIGFCILFFLLIFSIPSLYLASALFLLLVYFWSTFLGAAQSWMVHEVARGKDTTLASGINRAFHNLLDILAFAVVTVLIKILIGAIRQRGGRIGEAAGSFLDLVTGIAGKLVLPAMIVTERNFGEAVRRLGSAIKAIPEIATFEIGIRPLTTLIFFVNLGISILIGLPFGFIVGVLTFVILTIALILFSILINQIYYTLLYLTLIEKKKVPGLKLTH